MVSDTVTVKKPRNKTLFGQCEDDSQKQFTPWVLHVRIDSIRSKVVSSKQGATKTEISVSQLQSH